MRKICGIIVCDTPCDKYPLYCQHCVNAKYVPENPDIQFPDDCPVEEI